MKSDSEKIKIQVSKLLSNIKLTITKNLRNFPKNFKNIDFLDRDQICLSNFCRDKSIILEIFREIS